MRRREETVRERDGGEREEGMRWMEGERKEGERWRREERERESE